MAQFPRRQGDGCNAIVFVLCVPGDLGALLLCSGSHLVGLASHVADDGCGRSPYVYTYTGNLRNWIESGGIGMSIVIENPHSDCEGLADV